MNELGSGEAGTHYRTPNGLCVGNGVGQVEPRVLRHSVDKGPDMPLSFDVGCHGQSDGKQEEGR